MLPARFPSVSPILAFRDTGNICFLVLQRSVVFPAHSLSASMKTSTFTCSSQGSCSTASIILFDLHCTLSYLQFYSLSLDNQTIGKLRVKRIFLQWYNTLVLFAVPSTCYIIITELLFDKNHISNQSSCTALNPVTSQLLLEAMSASTCRWSLDTSTTLIWTDATEISHCFHVSCPCHFSASHQQTTIPATILIRLVIFHK